jgi:epoxyqueuosine reductase
MSAREDSAAGGPAARGRVARDTATVRRLAHAGGFDLVGFARYAPLDPAVLDRWLARGWHGRMTWMAEGRDARVDPAVLLPSVRTVVALAINYWHPGDTALEGGGRVSRYAWGRDYHKELGGRLSRLRRRLAAEFPGLKHWGGSDAVPIMEKVWAERAGLGWIGKSGNLVTRRFGTWVFLATLLVDLELEADAPHADHCGSCTACLSACPTGAIVSPGRVDARRCLSYHSIEHAEAWPQEIAGRAEGWMYGCDTCQDVCPWSVKFARPGLDAFAPRPAIMGRRLADWVRLDREGWEAVTAGSALRRPEHAGLVRDACAAAGTAPADADLDAALETRVDDPEPAVRAMARWALGRRRRGGPTR